MLTPVPGNSSRFSEFIARLSALLDSRPTEPRLVAQGSALLESLVSADDWLIDEFAVPHPQHYQQYLLYLDPQERFSVVSFVWGPGQTTPVHNHLVWGLLGVLRGAEKAQSFVRVDEAGSATGQRFTEAGAPQLLRAGQVDVVSPTVGDIHQVSNAFDNEVSVSIHVYGANVGSLTRSVFTRDGSVRPFVSGYANAVLPAAGSLPRTLSTTTTAEVRQALLERSEIALIDVREEDPFAAEHPLFAANFPLSRLELDAYGRIPRRSTRIVVYDNGEGLARIAAQRLTALGYSHVSLLQGGLAAWRDVGYQLFKDVNVPSKAFGELVESIRHTPSLAADEVKALLDAKADVVVLDARPFEEYNTMNIPGGINVPGGELALRARAMAPNASTTVIVNCAGRTRSIIGTQSLVNAGIANPVAALRNGTIGWTLAGHRLEHGQRRRFQDKTTHTVSDDPASASAAASSSSASSSAESVAAGAKAEAGAATAATIDIAASARALAVRAGVRFVSLQDVELARADNARTTYLFDVRTAEEFEAGHLPGARHAPGGQLVQEADVFAPVRGARIALTDTGSASSGARIEADPFHVRACMTASWLAQMNIDVWVVEGVAEHALTGTGRWRAPVPDLADLGPSPSLVTPAMAKTWLDAMHDSDGSTTVMIDLGRSARYVREHVPGAWFALRSELARALRTMAEAAPTGHETRHTMLHDARAGTPDRYVLTADDDALAALAAADMAALTDAEIHVMQGGIAAWRASGFSVESGDARLASPRIDRYRRPYEGTDNPVDAMQGYLDWEYGLVEQLRLDGTHGFKVI